MDISLVYWDHSLNKILLLNLAIVISLFASIRLFSGTISHINASDELLKKDNPAFGISLVGVLFAVTIVLSGAIYGDPIQNMTDSAIAIGLYGLLGIILMAITRIIFDKLAFPNISIRDEIVKGNVAAAIIDAGNVIAAALVIRAVMIWVTTNTIEGLTALLVSFAISQAILTFLTYLRIKTFSRQNGGKSFEAMFEEGNTALALRFAGRKIGAAFAITAASHIMVYEVYDAFLLLAPWVGVSLIMVAVLGVLSYFADSIILFRVDRNKEIVQEKNIAVGALQAFTYISLGLLLAELMS